MSPPSDFSLCIRLLNIDTYFYVGWVWRCKWNKNCKRQFCSVRTLFTDVTLPYMSHIIGFINCSLWNKLTVKPNVAHGVKADRLSSVCWKDIFDVHCTDRVTVAAYRCIEEDNCTVNCKRCLTSSVVPLFIGSICSVVVASVHVCGRCVDDVAFAVLRGTQRLFSVKYLFEELSKKFPEFSITRGRLTIIFKAYLINSLRCSQV